MGDLITRLGEMQRNNNVDDNGKAMAVIILEICRIILQMLPDNKGLDYKPNITIFPSSNNFACQTHYGLVLAQGGEDELYDDDVPNQYTIVLFYKQTPSRFWKFSIIIFVSASELTASCTCFIMSAVFRTQFMTLSPSPIRHY